MMGFKRGVFSWLPNNKYYKVGVKSLNQDLKNLEYHLLISVNLCICIINTNPGSGLIFMKT